MNTDQHGFGPGFRLHPRDEHQALRHFLISVSIRVTGSRTPISQCDGLSAEAPRAQAEGRMTVGRHDSEPDSGHC